MIVKHEVSTIIARPKRENMFDFLTQALNCISKSEETLEIIEDTESGMMDSFDEIDSLAEQRFDDMEGIRAYVAGCYTMKPSLLVCARDVVLHMTGYNQSLNDYVNYGMLLGETEHKVLKDVCKRIISELCYLLRFEFDVELHAQKLEAGEDYIDEILKMYCDSYQVSLESLLNRINEIRTKFPFHLSVFDDYPEYEAQFETIMGPFMGGLVEKDLTLKQIEAVIDGKMTPEELLNEFSGQELEDDDYEGTMKVF